MDGTSWLKVEKLTERNASAARRDCHFFAHTSPIEGGDWQPLEQHLLGVAERAAEFADAFGAREWGYLAGLWHDLGKYSDAFQEYLRRAADPDVHGSDGAPKTDHSTAGAQLAARRLGGLGHLVAFPIAGHHSGLLDAIGASACLERRLAKDVEDWESNAPARVLEGSDPQLPHFVRRALGERRRFSIAFFVRMLFSCLVDADFLDTGAFMDPRRERNRPGWPDDILERMEASLDEHLAAFGPPANDVDRQRSEVLDACVRAAPRPPGFFSLTVPTGGGKTLSSLAFALSHARTHGLRRVVYVAPFTSIIEQNADVFRAAMGGLDGTLPDPIIEHHSNLDPERETTWSRLAAENWDAPLIVTTAVQFYESLFANRTSRCRKLHNLARSVVILDEAQCLPVDYLEPCLRALEELCQTYGTSVVLCSATQPAIHRSEKFPIGVELSPDREIVDDPPALFSELKRVTIRREGVVTDEELVRGLEDHERVLCIVNTRRHARALFELLQEREASFHLSANMCPEHRSDTLAEINHALAERMPCRVVSTQVVEAGVDIDFPVVYRALAGVDSIAQAAGRCNRNGTLTAGETVVFESEHQSSERFLADTAGSARQVLALHQDPLSLEAVGHYFRLYYWEQEDRWDSRNILDRFQLDPSPEFPFLFGFASAARDFHLIEDRGVTVFIPWGKIGQSLCDDLRQAWAGAHRGLLRKLQRYTVQVPWHVWKEHGEAAFEMTHDHYPVLSFPEDHYSEHVGLRLNSGVSDHFIV